MRNVLRKKINRVKSYSLASRTVRKLIMGEKEHLPLIKGIGELLESM
jgi:hypothetical protein